MTHLEHLIKKVEEDYNVLADELVEEILDIREDLKRIDEIYEGRMRKLQENYRNERDTIQSRIDYKRFLLSEIIDKLEFKETKTQKKVELVSGDIIVKNKKIKLVPNKEKVIEEIREAYPEFIKHSEIETLEWCKMKEEVQIDNSGKVFIDRDGEQIYLRGIEVHFEEEEMVIEGREKK